MFSLSLNGAIRSRRANGGGGGGVIAAATISVIAGYISDQVNKEVFDLGSPICRRTPIPVRHRLSSRIPRWSAAADRSTRFAHSRRRLRRCHRRGRDPTRSQSAPGAFRSKCLRSCSSTRLRRRGSRDSVRSKKTGAKRTATGSFEILPIKVAFDAQHPCAELAAHSHGAADQTAVDVEVPGRTKARRIERVAFPLPLAKRVAAVYADISPAPIVDGGDR